MASPQVTSFGTPTLVRATSGSVTGTWGTGQNRPAGHVLVALVTAGGTTASAAALNTPAGWAQVAVISNVATTANTWAAVYTKTAAGSDSAPAFTATLTGTVAMTCTLLELPAASCLAIIDTYGTYASGGAAGSLTSMSATTVDAICSAGSYAIGLFCQEAAAATNTWTPGTSWTNLVNDGATSSVLHTAADYYANPAAGSTLNEAGSWSTHATAFGAGIVIAVAPQTSALELFTNEGSTTISSGGTGAPALGTPEVWTASSWSSFPTASPTATPPTAFHVADPALPGELIEVVNTATGLVIRGAEGTTPVSHAGGFTIQNVMSAGYLNSMFGLRPSGDTTGVTDRANIQGLLNIAGKAILQSGLFWINAALQMYSVSQLTGASLGVTTIRAIASYAPGQVGSNTGAVMLATAGEHRPDPHHGKRHHVRRQRRQYRLAARLCRRRGVRADQLVEFQRDHHRAGRSPQRGRLLDLPARLLGHQRNRLPHPGRRLNQRSMVERRRHSPHELLSVHRREQQCRHRVERLVR